MRYVAIEKAKDNMVLAMPIYDSINRVLLATGTIMTRDYIRKLKARGLPGFYVEDELAKDIEVQDIVTQELRNEGVEALQRGDLDACMKVAERIVEQILSRPPIRLDMIDLRMFDDYTYRHSVNVAVMSTVIALNLGFNKKKLKDAEAELKVETELKKAQKSKENIIVEMPQQQTTQTPKLEITNKERGK